MQNKKPVFPGLLILALLFGIVASCFLGLLFFLTHLLADALLTQESSWEYYHIFPAGLLFGFTAALMYFLGGRYLKNKIILILLGLLTLSIAAIFSQYIDAPGVNEALSYLTGFIFGLAAAQLKASWWQKTLAGLLGVIILALYYYFYVQPGLLGPQLSFSLQLYQWISLFFIQSFFGFAIGITVHTAQVVYAAPERASWIKLFFWLIAATGFGILYMRYFQYNNELVFYCLLAIAIANSQGARLIKRGKLQYSYIEDRNSFQALLNAKRLLYGLIIGVSYAAPICFYQLYKGRHLGDNINSLINQSISYVLYALALGLIIGCIYGFGPLLLDRFSRLVGKPATTPLAVSHPYQGAAMPAAVTDSLPRSVLPLIETLPLPAARPSIPLIDTTPLPAAHWPRQQHSNQSFHAEKQQPPS